jgi:hypothetical protein
MCITSIECKTVIIAMLTVMSSMDPYMISWDIGWFRNGWLIGVPVGAGDSVGSYPLGAGYSLS